MDVSRRDFMKVVGVSIASMVMAGCRPPVVTTCYAALPPTPGPEDDSPRGRLRRCWTSFSKLQQVTTDNAALGTTDDQFGVQLVSDHRLALDELVTSGAISTSVAELVHEAYQAAVYHVWRSNVPITCYEPVLINFSPASAEVLVQQAAALDSLDSGGTIDAEVLEKARLALEHDLAFYELTDQQVNALYERLLADWESQQQAPDFASVEIDVSPDAEAAARFILDLITIR